MPHRNLENWAEDQYKPMPIPDETRRAAIQVVADYAAYNLWENGETQEILQALGLDEREECDTRK